MQFCFDVFVISFNMLCVDCNFLNTVAISIDGNASANLDIVCVKSFFIMQTFNFSSDRMPGLLSQRDSISQSAKHYFRLSELAIEIYVKTQKLFVFVRTYCIVPCILCISRNDDNERRFCFRNVRIRIYNYASSLSCTRGGRFVRIDVGAYAV